MANEFDAFTQYLSDDTQEAAKPQVGDMSQFTRYLDAPQSSPRVQAFQKRIAPPVSSAATPTADLFRPQQVSPADGGVPSIFDLPEEQRRVPEDFDTGRQTGLLKSAALKVGGFLGGIGRGTAQSVFPRERDTIGGRLGRGLAERILPSEELGEEAQETQRLIGEARKQTLAGGLAETFAEPSKVEQAAQRLAQKQSRQIRSNLGAVAGTTFDVGNAAWQLAARLFILRRITGKFPGQTTGNQSTNLTAMQRWGESAKATINHAWKTAGLVFTTTQGTETEKAQAAAITFAYLFTPAASTGVPNELGAKMVDMALNTGITAGLGTFKDAKQAAIEDAKRNGLKWNKMGKVEQRARIAGFVVPSVLADLFFSLMTKSSTRAVVEANTTPQEREQLEGIREDVEALRQGEIPERVLDSVEGRVPDAIPERQADEVPVRPPPESGEEVRPTPPDKPTEAGVGAEEAVRQSDVDSVKAEFQAELDAIPQRNTRQRREHEALLRDKISSLDPVEREAARQLFHPKQPDVELPPIEPDVVKVDVKPVAEMSVPELKDEAGERGLSQKGTPKGLKQRITDARDDDSVRDFLRDTDADELTDRIVDIRRKAVEQFGNEEPITSGQNKALHAEENRSKISPQDKRIIKQAISGGRTDTSSEFTRAEASAYIDVLRRYGKSLKDIKTMPTIAAERQATPKSVDMQDVNVKRLLADVESERQLLKKPREKVGVNAFWDVYRALDDVESKTGIPFAQKYKKIRNIDRDIQAFAHDRIEGLFEGTDLSWRQVHNNPAIESKMFDYLNTGVRPAAMTDSEFVVAERMREAFSGYENLVKQLRHKKYMATGELPPDMKGAEGKAVMEEGASILREQGQDAYDAWIRSQTFGLREFYVPIRHQGQFSNLKQIFNRKFGRGFTKTREGEVTEYNPADPLLGAFYRYLRRAERIQRLEPELDKFQDMFKESGVEHSAMKPYFDRMYGSYQWKGAVSRANAKLMRQFFRVQIPQKIAKWVARNRLQNTANTLPKTFKPLDPIWWKNLPKLYQGFTKFGRHGAVIDKMLKDPEVNNHFRRYVDSMDVARQEYMFQEFNEMEVPLMKGLMGLTDMVSRGYSMSDTANRLEAFFFGYSTGKEALDRYRANPTEKNLQSFMDITGLSIGAKEAYVEALSNINAGNDKQAALIAAEHLSDSTQFRYNISEKGLEWMDRGSATALVFPIATYSKGTIQNLWKDGLKHLMVSPKRMRNPQVRHRAFKGATHVGMWYAASLVANQMLEELYDVPEGSYGINTLRLVPGGPVLSIAMRGGEAIWDTIKNKKGWDYKLAQTADDMGDAFIPLYHLLTRMTSNVKGRRWKPFMEIRRGLKEWVAERSGSDSPTDQRRWIERTTIEQMQNIVFDGAWESKREDIIKKMAEYWRTTDPEKRVALEKEVNEMLRKHAVSTKRKDVPRRLENIEDLLPNLPKELKPPSFGDIKPTKAFDKELEGIEPLKGL